MIPPLVRKFWPAFYFVRLDTINEISGHNWLLIVYIPDETKVKSYFITFLKHIIRKFRFVNECYTLRPSLH